MPGMAGGLTAATLASIAPLRKIVAWSGNE